MSVKSRSATQIHLPAMLTHELVFPNWPIREFCAYLANNVSIVIDPLTKRVQKYVDIINYTVGLRSSSASALALQPAPH